MQRYDAPTIDYLNVDDALAELLTAIANSDFDSQITVEIDGHEGDQVLAIIDRDEFGNSWIACNRELTALAPTNVCIECGDQISVDGRELCFGCYSDHEGRE